VGREGSLHYRRRRVEELTEYDRVQLIKESVIKRILMSVGALRGTVLE